jgi:hypothetical protein
VKIRGTCLNCGRDFLTQQVLDSGGHCWNCHKPYQPHYTALLADSLQQAEVAGSVLETALEHLAGMDPAMVLHEDTILGEITAHLATLRAHADALASEVAREEAAAR